MSELEKLKRFKEALEKGKLGKVESFEFWLESNGINPRKTSYNYITNYFIENPFKIINFEKEIEIIGEFIGFYLNDKENTYHLPILGVSGSGKTILLTAVQTFLNKLDENVNVKFFEASLFGEINENEEEEQYLFKITDKLLQDPQDVIIIDSCGKDKNIDYSLKRIHNSVKKGVFITCWSPERWISLQDHIEDFLTTSKEIILEPLKRDEIRDLVTEVFGIISEKKVKPPTGIPDLIFEFSWGIPGIAIKILLTSLKEAFLKQKKFIDKESIEFAARKMSIYNIAEKLSKLTDQQFLILKQILMSYDERGIRPKQLTNLLNRDKATISYHLQSLRSEGFLEVDKIGRFSFYRIKEEIKPFIQLKVMQEVDFYV